MVKLDHLTDQKNSVRNQMKALELRKELMKNIVVCWRKNGLK